jgi:hypothetical protein
MRLPADHLQSNAATDQNLFPSDLGWGLLKIQIVGAGRCVRLQPAQHCGFLFWGLGTKPAFVERHTR